MAMGIWGTGLYRVILGKPLRLLAMLFNDIILNGNFLVQYIIGIVSSISHTISYRAGVYHGEIRITKLQNVQVTTY
jgi:hypothetical protein